MSSAAIDHFHGFGRPRSIARSTFGGPSSEIATSRRMLPWRTEITEAFISSSSRFCSARPTSGLFDSASTTRSALRVASCSRLMRKWAIEGTNTRISATTTNSAVSATSRVDSRSLRRPPVASAAFSPLVSPCRSAIACRCPPPVAHATRARGGRKAGKSRRRVRFALTAAPSPTYKPDRPGYSSLQAARRRAPATGANGNDHATVRSRGPGDEGVSP